jgi:1,4-dihydroxy-2-naphthoyl-CoA synthase
MDLGWINHVVPDDELEDEVDRWCQELAAMSPRYMELAKASSNVMYHQFRDNMVQGLNSLIQAIGSSDMKEGAAAFMDKRRPNFSPRDEL